jgi:hypothetical protein
VLAGRKAVQRGLNVPEKRDPEQSEVDREAEVLRMGSKLLV